MIAPTIAATNLVCSVGLESAPACAAMRAGINWFEELEYLDDHLQPIVGSAISAFPRSTSIRDRLQTLLEWTLGPLFDHPSAAAFQAISLHFAFVERTRPGADELARQLYDEALAQLGKRCAASYSSLDHGGGPAGFIALARARQLLDSGQVDACIVCGLDSWLDARSLLWLSRRTALRTVDRAGLIPGEAGAALLLTRTAHRNHPHPRLLGLGVGLEPSVTDPDQPLRADGLRDAVAAALRDSALGLHDIALRLSDDTGTHAGAKEQMLLLSRLLRVPVADMPLWLVAESVGHVGAAAGLAQIIRMTEAYNRGYLPGPRSLCTTGNFDGQRAAAIIESPWPPPRSLWS